MFDAAVEATTDRVTVSIVVRDARGFTHHYEDFTTSADNAQRALETLAEGYAHPEQEPTRRPAPRPLGARARVTRRTK